MIDPVTITAAVKSVFDLVVTHILLNVDLTSFESLLAASTSTD